MQTSPDIQKVKPKDCARSLFSNAEYDEEDKEADVVGKPRNHDIYIQNRTEDGCFAG